MIDPNELFTGVAPFVHVAELSSFRRAAERLGISTAAVSKAVARLEDRLGVRLLKRSSRTVTLTPEGKLFQVRAREAVASLQSGHAQLTNARSEPRGEVRVSTSFIIGPIIVGALPTLVARYPDLVVHLELTDRVSGLVSDETDVAIRVGARTSSALVSKVLYRPRWVTVASPDFVARHGAPRQPTDLARFACLRFVDPKGQPVPWWFADADAGAASHEVTGNLLVNQGEMLIAAACAGVGIAQLLDFMVVEQLRTGRLVEVLGPHVAPGPLIHAVTAPGRRSANIRAIVELATMAFGGLSSPASSPSSRA